MKYKKILSLISTGIVVVMPVAAGAIGRPITTTTTMVEAETKKVANIQSRGNAEITRRLKVLDKLAARIAATTKLTASDKATLSGGVTDTINGLKALQQQLDADTSLSVVRVDAQNILDEYRVFALVVPKILLISTADAQQQVEAQLSTLADKLQTRLQQGQAADHDISAASAKLSDMKQAISAAQALSLSVTTAVLPLQPSNYNSDHTILSGYHGKLVAARQDIGTAYNDAKAIMQIIKGWQ